MSDGWDEELRRMSEWTAQDRQRTAEEDAALDNARKEVSGIVKRIEELKEAAALRGQVENCKTALDAFRRLMTLYIENHEIEGECSECGANGGASCAEDCWVGRFDAAMLQYSPDTLSTPTPERQTVVVQISGEVRQALRSELLFIEREMDQHREALDSAGLSLSEDADGNSDDVMWTVTGPYDRWAAILSSLGTVDVDGVAAELDCHAESMRVGNPGPDADDLERWAEELRGKKGEPDEG